MTKPTGNPPGRPRKAYGTPGPRSLHPSICTSETLADTSLLAQLLFDRLIVQADDQGRLKGSARHVRAECVPLLDDVNTADVDLALEELAKARAITRYTIEGRQCVQITGWWEFQGHQRNIYPSRLPAPEGWSEDRVLGHGEHDDRVSAEQNPVTGEENRVSDGSAHPSPPQPRAGGVEKTGDAPESRRPNGSAFGTYQSLGGNDSDTTRELIAEMVTDHGEDAVMAALQDVHATDDSLRTLISRTRSRLGKKRPGKGGGKKKNRPGGGTVTDSEARCFFCGNPALPDNPLVTGESALRIHEQSTGDNDGECPDPPRGWGVCEVDFEAMPADLLVRTGGHLICPPHRGEGG